MCLVEPVPTQTQPTAAAKLSNTGRDLAKPREPEPSSLLRLSHLDGAGDASDLMDRIDAEDCCHAQAAEVVAGFLETGEFEVAFATIGGGRRDRGRAVSDPGDWAAFQVTLLV